MSDSIAIDIFSGDGPFAVDKLQTAGQPWALGMAKVSQGNYYNGGAWLAAMWPLLARTPRYGIDWFRLPYLYVDIGIDGAVQADYFLQQLEKVGGLGRDPFIVIDVERGGQRTTPTKTRIVDVGSKCSAVLRDKTGRKIICYGGETLRENNVTITDLGCELGWVADYGSFLPAKQYESIGCDLAHLFAWQYGGKNGDGSESALINGYPHTTPAGNVDLSALTFAGGGAAAIAALAAERAKFL